MIPLPDWLPADELVTVIEGLIRIAILLCAAGLLMSIADSARGKQDDDRDP